LAGSHVLLLGLLVVLLLGLTWLSVDNLLLGLTWLSVDDLLLGLHALAVNTWLSVDDSGCLGLLNSAHAEHGGAFL